MLRIPRNSSKTLCNCLKHNGKSLKALRHLHKLQSHQKIHLKSSKIIRNEFLNYFKNLNHKFIQSSRVDPVFDPLVAFTNAGMNQFKPIFLGELEPPCLRAVNHQKCVRVGGKHNDLEAVGKDTYHHTFFEMLGSWSFGDYRKREACDYAWGLLTGPFAIPKDRLYVTYFKGDDSLNLPADTETKEIWLSLGVPAANILPFGAKENFWEMGPTGPCGLCTEIHVSTSANPQNQSSKVNQGHSDLKELWNLVFIEYQRLEDGSVLPLANHHVDTGMGFERLVAILQGKESNYDTDLFSHIFEGIRTFSGANEYRGRVGEDDDDGVDTGYRILADHARMISVCLADGMIPEVNHKVRRVLRRAVDVGTDVFRKERILGEICARVAESLGEVYPEVPENLKHIQTIVNYEEDLLKALKKSSGKQWQDLVASRPILSTISDPYLAGLYPGYRELQKSLPNIKGPKLPGELAFKLYESHGLDVETIGEFAEIEGLKFDEKDFNKYLDAAKMRSRVGSAHAVRKKIDESFNVFDQLVEPTDDSLKYNYIFEGDKCEFPAVEAKILGIFVNGDLIKEKSFELDESLKNTEIGLILDKTSFYSPGGGQQSDKGHLEIKNLNFKVSEIQKIKNYVIHMGNFDSTNFNGESNLLSIGDGAKVFLDVDNRVSLMRHHTATHLLNAALRKVFPAVSQRGSLVKNDCLIFQFSSYGKVISPEDVKLIEKFVNDSISDKVTVKTNVVDRLQFESEKNLVLVPGTIYPDDDLRIVEIDGNNLKSKEACCGTHVHNTSFLNHFKIIEVTSKGSSSRTIKAVAGPQAQYLLPTVTENLSKISTSSPEVLKDTNKKKEMVEDFLKFEIQFAMETSDNFVVHCLSSSLIEVESIPLQKANEFCCDKPILLISKSSRKVKARCFVPEEFLSDEFNAKLWMEAVNNHLTSKIGSFPDENPLLTSHTRVCKLKRNEIIERVKKALKEARNFALKNCKKK